MIGKLTTIVIAVKDVDHNGAFYRDPVQLVQLPAQSKGA